MRTLRLRPRNWPSYRSSTKPQLRCWRRPVHPSKISREWAALANDISAKAVDMISRDKVKILGPLFHIKYKTGLNRETIAMSNAALAVGLKFGSIEPFERLDE